MRFGAGHKKPVTPRNLARQVRFLLSGTMSRVQAVFSLNSSDDSFMNCIEMGGCQNMKSTACLPFPDCLFALPDLRMC